jgi:signal transduction histidine kinase
MRFRPDPKKLMRLPGFFKAGDLIPGYPFVSGGTTSLEEEEEDGVDGGSVGLRRQREMFASASNDRPVSVSAVEEIPLSSMPGSSAHRTPPSLSVSLFGGLDTLGVLVIWPTSPPHDVTDIELGWTWTSDDKLQVSRAARSLALALSMDNELTSSKLANENFRVRLADGMHQVKSPLQALRTFGKLLQRQLAESGGEMERGPTTRAMKLAEDLMSQGERVIDLIEPMDALIRSDPGGGADSKYLLRGDVKGKDPFLLLPMWDETSSTSSKLVPYQFVLPPPMPVFGDMELEMTFPQDVLGTIVYASQAISRERGIKLDAIGFDPDNDLSGVFVCVRHLTEAISNILDNAIKYAPLRRSDGGGTQQGKRLVGRPRIPHIKVTLESNKPPLAPGATLYVEDNGPGIPSFERDKVFLRGYRGQSCQDVVDGSGLGLAIAKEMITRMGGELEILDEGPNQLDGTTLRVVLFRDPLNR